MLRLALALAIALTNAASRAAPKPRIVAMLKRIAPSERLTMLCEYEAADRIGRDRNPYHPDRAVLDSLAPVKIKGDVAEGTGGAIRSRGQWYQFSFYCKSTPDRLDILSFNFRVGEKIPRDQWRKYGLWR